MITYHPQTDRPYWSFEGVDVFGRFYLLEADTKEELIEAVLECCMASTAEYAERIVDQYDERPQ